MRLLAVNVTEGCCCCCCYCCCCFADDASFDEPDSGISLHQETPKSIPSPSPRPTEPLKQEEPLPPSSSLPLPPPPEIQQQQQQQQQPTTTERLQSFTADTFRASEVCTPGSAIHSAVPNIFEHCRNPEGDTFLPSFPPGRILHIEFPPQTPTGCVHVHVHCIIIHICMYYYNSQ